MQLEGKKKLKTKTWFVWDIVQKFFIIESQFEQNLNLFKIIVKSYPLVKTWVVKYYPLIEEKKLFTN